MLTALAVATQTIAVIGPTLGGLLITAAGWRSLFAVNIPLAAACLVLGWRRLPRTDRPVRAPGGLDVPGIALFAAMLTTLLLFLMQPRPDRAWLVALSVATVAGFAVRELRAARPFIDLRVFGGNIPLLATYARTLLAYTVSYCFIYGYTQWLEAGRGLSASAAGLVLLPVFATGIVVAILTGRRQQIRAKLVVGGLGQITACGLLLLLGPTSGVVLLLAVGFILGLPQGLVSLANQNAVYWQADPARMGASAGLLRTFMYLGAMTASVANGAFFGTHADTAGLHRLAVFMLATAGLFLVLTLVDRSLGRVGGTGRAAGEGGAVGGAAAVGTRAAG